MIIEYQSDPYITSIYARFLSTLPLGTFYPQDRVVLPYSITPTKFKLTGAIPGKRHVIARDTVPYTSLTIIPDTESPIIHVPLEMGTADLIVTAIDYDGTLLDQGSYPVTVTHFGTMLYGVSQAMVTHWVDILDFYNQAISGYQLLVFETSLSPQLREHLPQDPTTRIIALKNLMRSSLLGSSTEGILSFISAMCQMNPPKLDRFFNGEKIQNDRLEDGTFENAAQDIKLWFGSYAQGRRAVLTRLASNFPEKYTGLTAQDSSLILALPNPKNEVPKMPADVSTFVILEEDDNPDLTKSLGLYEGDSVEFSTESLDVYFIPNYNWVDYNDFHYFNDTYVYVPKDVVRYGDQRWFRDWLGCLDRISEIYAIPDFPESRIDPTGLETDTRKWTLQWANQQFLSTFGLLPIEKTSTDDYTPIPEAHLMGRVDRSDNIAMDVSVGESQAWVRNDWPYDIDYSLNMAIDYHQGLKASSFSYSRDTILCDAGSEDPYLTDVAHQSLLVMPYFSRRAMPGTLPTLDWPARYGEDDIFVAPYGRGETFIKQQRIGKLPQEWWNEKADSSVPVHLYLETQFLGWCTTYDFPCKVLNSATGKTESVSAFSTNETVEEFMSNQGVIYSLHGNVVLVLHRDNRNGAISLICVSNPQYGERRRNIPTGSTREFCNMEMVFKGLRRDQRIIDGAGTRIRLEPNRLVFDMAWRYETQASVTLLDLQNMTANGIQGFTIDLTKEAVSTADISDVVWISPNGQSSLQVGGGTTLTVAISNT